VALASLTACGDDGGPAGEGLSDQQIIGVLVTTGEAEVTLGQAVQLGAMSNEAREFASQLVLAHGEALQRARTLSDNARLPPTDSLLQEDLALELERQQDLLEQAAGGLDYDLLFACGQLRFHDDFADHAEKTLRPSASSPDVRQLIDDQRDLAEEQMERARTVVRALSRMDPPLACATRGGI
jgi:predicted outer membrane protein